MFEWVAKIFPKDGFGEAGYFEITTDENEKYRLVSSYATGFDDYGNLLVDTGRFENFIIEPTKTLLPIKPYKIQFIPNYERLC